MESTTDIDPEAETDEPKRKRGRPPGTPKTGGRQSIKTPAELRAHIVKELGRLDGLLSIARNEQQRVSGPGGRSVLSYPSINERLKAWQLLMAKAIPDLQAQQITGANDGPVQVEASAAIIAIREALSAQLVSAPPAPAIEHEPDTSKALATAHHDYLAGVPDKPAAFETGERILIDGLPNGWIEATGVRNGDGRFEFAICNKYGERLTRTLGREKAEELLRQYNETGRISR